MKRTARIVSLLLPLVAGPVLAAEPAMSDVKSMAMKERSEMMSQAKSIDAQISAAMKTAESMSGSKAKQLDAQLAELQKQVRALTARLEQAPKYFDDPTSNPNRP